MNCESVTTCDWCLKYPTLKPAGSPNYNTLRCSHTTDIITCNSKECCGKTFHDCVEVVKCIDTAEGIEVSEEGRSCCPHCFFKGNGDQRKSRNPTDIQSGQRQIRSGGEEKWILDPATGKHHREPPTPLETKFLCATAIAVAWMKSNRRHYFDDDVMYDRLTAKGLECAFRFRPREPGTEIPRDPKGKSYGYEVPIGFACYCWACYTQEFKGRRSNKEKALKFLAYPDDSSGAGIKSALNSEGELISFEMTGSPPELDSAGSLIPRLSCLTEYSRRVFLLRTGLDSQFEGELSYQEIAELLGTQVKNVRSTFCKAKKELGKDPAILTLLNGARKR